MRSKAPPPMSARGAMQFRRDGAKRSCRNGAAELSEAHARGSGVGIFSRCRPQAGEKLRDALSIAVLNSGDVDGYIARVLSGIAGLVFERSTAASRTVTRWRRELGAARI
jgi:hypothetical protein